MINCVLLALLRERYHRKRILDLDFLTKYFDSERVYLVSSFLGMQESYLKRYKIP